VIGAPYGGFTKRNPERWRKMMSGLLGHVGAGVLRPVIHRQYPFEQAADALAEVAERRVVGKVVLVNERGRETQQ
jgi:NADPH2:quinone reductase